MKACMRGAMAGIVLLACVSNPCAAETQTYLATITLGNGRKTHVEDVQFVYAWRELPIQGTGLLPYQDRQEVGRGVRTIPAAGSAVELTSFDNLSAMEFETEIRQRGGSQSYQFLVRRIHLRFRDGRKLDCSSTLLSDGMPVLWPHGKSVKFPPIADGKRIEQIEVSLQGKTKSEGQDAEFVFAFPSAMQEGIEPVMKKRQGSFPRVIEFTPSAIIP